MPWLTTTLIWLMARSWSTKSKSGFRADFADPVERVECTKDFAAVVAHEDSAVAIRFFSRLRMNG